MKRVLSLVLALVLVLGMIPTFAADATGAQALYDNGFITGKDGADLASKLDVNAQLTRAQLAALIAELNGAKEEAAAFEQPADFTDFATIAGWAKNYVSYAAVNGWMNGFTDGTFRANASVPAQQLVAVLMNALGYPVVWNTVLADAAKLGIVAEGAALTRGEAFEAMWYAVSEVKMADSDMTLGQHLGKLTPPTPVVTALAVKEVKATNLREVLITFNNEIDADSLKVENFLLGTTEATEVSLLDAKTVIAEFTMTNQTEYTLNIKSVMDKAKSEVKAFTQKFTVTDFAAPVVEKVVVSGNKKLVITFSEPVDPATATILGNYTINGLLFGGLVTVDDREVTIVTTARLADGVHTVVVSNNVTDFAGFKLVANSNQIVVAKDDVKPAIGTIVSATQTKVVVKFSEPVESTFTVAAGVGQFVDKTTKDNLTYTLNFNTLSPLPLSGTEITLTDVVDFYGNKDTLKFNVVPTIDLVRPEVKSVTATAQNKLLVEFTKEVDLAGTYTLKTVATTPVTKALNAPAYYVNDDGDQVKSKVVLTAAAALAAGDYTLEVTGVKDLTPLFNVMVPYTAVVKVADLTKPAVASVLVTQPTLTDAGALYIKFTEKVDPATAMDKANYSYILNSVKPVALGTAHTVSVLADGMTVKIVLPKVLAGEAPVTSVTIINVTDLAGNKIVSTVQSVGAVYTPGAPVVSAARATAVNKIVLTVTPNINPGTVTASDFIIQQAGTATTLIYVINAEYNADDNEITLTLNNNLTTTALYSGNPVEVSVIAQNLSNIFGEKVALTSTTLGTDLPVADKIAPTATKVESAKAEVVGSTTTAIIKINVNEALATPSLDDATDANFVIKLNGVLYVPTTYTVGYAVDVTAGPQLTITVTTATDLTGKSFSVEFFKNASLVDTATSANQLATFTFTGTLE
jgi:hypothetical protein